MKGFLKLCWYSLAWYFFTPDKEIYFVLEPDKMGKHKHSFKLLVTLFQLMIAQIWRLILCEVEILTKKVIFTFELFL